MKGWASVSLGGVGLLLLGCPGVEVPGGTAVGGGSTGDRPEITTFNSTIDPTVPGDGESSAEAGSTMGVLDGTTAEGGSTSEVGTTSDSGSTSDATSTTGPGSTMGSTGDPGSSSGSTGGGCHSVPGNYDNCLNMDGTTNTAPCMAAGTATCLIAGGMPPTAGVCSVQDCVEPCDCPAAPATGNAVVSCDDVTGMPADLFCYLDCGGGETCPTGMTCFAGFLCLWPGAGAAGVPYGDCFNNDASICGLDGVCLSDNAMAPTTSVCSTECMVAGDCPPAPPGGTSPVLCDDVTGDGAGECTLDCSGGASCPAGMTCFGGFLCAWT